MCIYKYLWVLNFDFLVNVFLRAVVKNYNIFYEWSIYFYHVSHDPNDRRNHTELEITFRQSYVENIKYSIFQMITWFNWLINKIFLNNMIFIRTDFVNNSIQKSEKNKSIEYSR